MLDILFTSVAMVQAHDLGSACPMYLLQTLTQNPVR